MRFQAQLFGRHDAQGQHEVAHVELVGTAGLGALLLSQPDFFFGDDGKLVERDERAVVGRNRKSYRH
jgi:hypothetical protein